MSSIFKFISRTDIFFYLLLWLIVLLVLGTIAQKDIGLYMAQQIYFSSYIMWISDVVPLPGGYIIMGAIFINLFAKLLSDEWSIHKAGIIITHIGAILLLFGGFVTAQFSYEGNMVIDEGASSNYISDHHKREFVVIDVSSSDADEVVAFGSGWLVAGKVLKSDSIPFTIKIEQFCKNCKITDSDTVQNNDNIRGIMRKVNIDNTATSINDSENISGVTFEISGAGDDSDGIYGVFEYMQQPQYIMANGRKYLLQIRRARTYFDFSIRLVDFEKQMHPGTNNARSYQSEVVLEEGDIEWRSVIKMNEPLRYKGYTFYQSSYIENGLQSTTVLSVVKNAGRLFPYISSIIMCIGLLIHLFQRMPMLIARNK